MKIYQNKSRLSKSSLVLAILIASGTSSSVGFAAEGVVEEVVVTGSNIRSNRDFDTPSPIQTLGLEQISDAGAGQVQDLFKNLAVNAGSETSTSQNGRQGVSQFSLRGLGVSGTLTLVNGRRAGVSPVTSDDGFFFTDSNQYPVNMIERIEVLTDGASATYGSEAVSGVVNIITRSNFEGAEFGVEYRNSINDAYLINAAVGSSFDKGHFTTFVNYYATGDAVARGDVGFIRERDNGGMGQLDTGSSWDSGTGAGQYNLAVLDTDDEFERTGNTVAAPDCGAPNAIGVVNTFVAGSNCRYSFINQRALIPEEERLQIFSQFDYQLTNALRVFAEASYSFNEIRDLIGGAVLRTTTDDGGFLVPGSHPFNYFTSNGDGGIAWDPMAVAANPGDAVDVIFRGRPLTTFDGALADDIVRNYDNGRFVIGFDADLFNTWNVNTSYMYARTKFSDRQPRSYNSAAFRAEVVSGRWNPFVSAWAMPDSISVKDDASVAGNTDIALGAFSTNRSIQQESIQTVAEIIFSGDLFELSNGNSIIAALGAQYRDFEYNDIQDSLSVFRLDGRADPVFSIDDASQDVYALFAEAIVPVLDTVEFQLAARYEDYGATEGGDTFDPKVGARWDVSDVFTVRGSWGTSFQAPSVRNVAGSVGSGALEDRATGITPGNACNAEADSFNAAQITEGGAGLKPQSATNYNLGLVMQTERFTGSIDYWVYDYKDLIQTGDDFQDILDNECMSGVLTPDPRVIRDPSGQLNSVRSNFVNVGKVEADGFDFNGRYNFGDVFGGEVMLSGTATYITSFDIFLDDSGSKFNAAGNRNRFIGFGSLPDLRANFSLDWRGENSNFNVTARHIAGYDDRTPTDDSAASISSQTLVDIQLGYIWDNAYGGGSISAALGATNLLDEDPPEVEVDRIAYDGQVGDPRGRTIYLRAKYSF